MLLQMSLRLPAQELCRRRLSLLCQSGSGLYSKYSRNPTVRETRPLCDLKFQKWTRETRPFAKLDHLWDHPRRGKFWCNFDVQSLIPLRKIVSNMKIFASGGHNFTGVTTHQLMDIGQVGARGTSEIPLIVTWYRYETRNWIPEAIVV